MIEEYWSQVNSLKDSVSNGNCYFEQSNWKSCPLVTVQVCQEKRLDSHSDVGFQQLIRLADSVEKIGLLHTHYRSVFIGLSSLNSFSYMENKFDNSLSRRDYSPRWLR